MTEQESGNHTRPAQEYKPPTAGDVAIMAKAHHWPRCLFRGVTIAGEQEWTAALASAEPDEREQLREALPDEDDDA